MLGCIGVAFGQGLYKPFCSVGMFCQECIVANDDRGVIVKHRVNICECKVINIQSGCFASHTGPAVENPDCIYRTAFQCRYFVGHGGRDQFYQVKIAAIGFHHFSNGCFFYIHIPCSISFSFQSFWSIDTFTGTRYNPGGIVLYHCRNGCDWERRISYKCRGQRILERYTKLGFSGSNQGFSATFRRLYDFHSNTGFFKIAVCLCCKYTGMIGIWCPVQHQCDGFKFIGMINSTTTGQLKQKQNA